MTINAQEAAPSDGVHRARQEWIDSRLGPALAAKPERKTSFHTKSGMSVNTLYTPADVPNIDYDRDLGFPGQFPFTRGVDPAMYRSELWTMGQYAGFGSAEDSNRRYKYLVEKGATGFSIALDLPTQTGYDSDDPRAIGEVGKVGVALNSLRDMEILLDGVPLTRVRQIRTTANAIGPFMLCLFLGAAELQGVDPRSFNVLVQNDPLKEYIGRGTWIFPPAAAVRLTADVMEYCARHVSNWTSVNVSGYHIRESGSTAVQELAFAFGHARAYLDATLARGVTVDAVAPSIWMFLSAETDLLEEVAKYRAARRLWARMLRDEYDAHDPRSMQLRFLGFTAGSAFTAQQPINNVVRATIQVLAAALAGVQSLHCSGYDEAIGLPTEEAVTLALRTQQIVAEESGVTNTVDPLGGSFYVEALTNRIEAEARAYMRRVAEMGGAVAAIDCGFVQGEVARASWEFQQRVERRQQVVVGVNEYQALDREPTPVFRVDPEVEPREAAKLQKLRAERDSGRVERSLAVLAKEARAQANLVPAMLEAVRAYATVGEIFGVLRSVLGNYRDPGFV